ncbi:hypothetical protein JD844_003879, partial [Phrynosoma platyrhinos]
GLLRKAGGVQAWGNGMTEDCQPPVAPASGSAKQEEEEEEEELPSCKMEESKEPWESAAKREVAISGLPAAGEPGKDAIRCTGAGHFGACTRAHCPLPSDFIPVGNFGMEIDHLVVSTERQVAPATLLA